MGACVLLIVAVVTRAVTANMVTAMHRIDGIILIVVECLVSYSSGEMVILVVEGRISRRIKMRK